MHPLVVLAKNLIYYIYYQLLATIINRTLLLVSVSVVLLVWYKRVIKRAYFCCIMAPWLLCWWVENLEIEQLCWHRAIKVCRLWYVLLQKIGSCYLGCCLQLKNIISQYPED
jgi:hypothetical protein